MSILASFIDARCCDQKSKKWVEQDSLLISKRLVTHLFATARVQRSGVPSRKVTSPLLVTAGVQCGRLAGWSGGIEQNRTCGCWKIKTQDGLVLYEVLTSFRLPSKGALGLPPFQVQGSCHTDHKDRSSKTLIIFSENKEEVEQTKVKQRRSIKPGNIQETYDQETFKFVSHTIISLNLFSDIFLS